MSEYEPSTTRGGRDVPHANAAAKILHDTFDKSTLARLVIGMLTSAGANSQWHSETIEFVLQPALAITTVTKGAIPTFADSDNLDALAFWRAIADDLNVQHDGPEEEPSAVTTYKIVRYFQDRGGQDYTVTTGLTLEEAQAHCNLESTHGDGWFDGYVEETD